MRSTACRRAAAWLAVAVHIAAPVPLQAQSAGVHGVRLSVWTHVAGVVDAADVDAARRQTESLLETAGVAIDWRDCRESDACSRRDETTSAVTLILTSTMRATCGTAQLGADGTQASLVVSVECVAQAARAVSQTQTARQHPLLSTLRPRHLLGAVIAHEIGHAFGLRHTSAGLMRARLEMSDVLLLREGRMAFSAGEAITLRASALGGSAAAMAGLTSRESGPTTSPR